MNDLLSKRELARGDGWRILAVKYRADSLNDEEMVVLQPDPFATTRELRKSLSVLLDWRNKIRDAQGVDPNTVGPAFERLLMEWHERALDPKINKDLAEAINGHIEDLYEHDPETADEWLDELDVSGEDRDMAGEWLTSDKVRNLLRNWRNRWRNAAVNPIGASDKEQTSE